MEGDQMERCTGPAHLATKGLVLGGPVRTLYYRQGVQHHRKKVTIGSPYVTSNDISETTHNHHSTTRERLIQRTISLDLY